MRWEGVGLLDVQRSVRVDGQRVQAAARTQPLGRYLPLGDGVTRQTAVQAVFAQCSLRRLDHNFRRRANHACVSQSKYSLR